MPAVAQRQPWKLARVLLRAGRNQTRNPCLSDAGVTATLPTPVLDDSEFGASEKGSSCLEALAMHTAARASPGSQMSGLALYLLSLDLRLSRGLGARHEV